MAYERLAKKNGVYRLGADRKCRCGYLAMTLRDLERHQRSGSSRYVSRGAFSYNRLLWCCYCNDDIPYTIVKFSEHMAKVHGVKPRLIFPVANQCPFCPFSCQSHVKMRNHIETCRVRFRLDLNLRCADGIFDLPLLPRASPPRYRPQNVTRAPGSLQAINGLANSATRAATLPSGVTTVRGNVVRYARFSAPPANAVPRPASVGYRVPGIPIAPACLPVAPVGILSTRLASGTSVSYALPVQHRYIYSGIATNQPLNVFRPVFGQPASIIMPFGSINQQVSEAVNQVLAKKRGSHDVATPSSSSSLPAVPDPQVKITGWHKPVGKDSPRSKAAPHRPSASATVSSVSSTLSNGKGNSSLLPVVALRRLSVSVCEVCGSTFEKPLLMRRHLLKAHSISVTVKDCLEGSPQKNQQCICCPLRFFSRQGLSRHMQIVHELPEGGLVCSRCSETGISDLIEHFRVKHGVTLRTMVDYRVCYLCKLNFSSLKDVESHIVSAHADIFPTRLHFRQAVRASVPSRKSTSNQTDRNPPANSNPEPALGAGRKRRHSVIEIAEDASDSVKVQTPNEKREQQSSDVVSVASSKTDGSPGTEPVTKKARKSLASPGTEPVTKKVQKSLATPGTKPITKKALKSGSSPGTESITKKPRKSGQGSAGDLSTQDVNGGKSNALSAKNKASEQRSSSALERGAVIGTVSQTTKNKQVVLVPLTKAKTGSSVNATNKPTGIADVSVRLTALKPVHKMDSSVTPLRKKKISSVDASKKKAAVPNVAVHLMPLKPISGTGSSVLPQSNGSKKTSSNTACKPAGLPEVSVRIPPPSTLNSEDTSAEKEKDRYRFV